MLRSITAAARALRDAAASTRPTYHGTCPHCACATPWHTNTLRGEYRCTRCGRSPLDA